MPNIEFGFLPTIIGSMPHTDPKKACALITRFLKDIPAWPQLPHRSFQEDMIVQSGEGFPGLVIEKKKAYVDRTRDHTLEMANLYAAFLSKDSSKFTITQDCAAGLHTFLSLKDLSPLAVKGQLTGPVSLAASLLDNDKKAIIHDEILTDAAVKLLKMKASWQEKALSQLSKNTIIFLDEPCLAMAGASISSGVLSDAGKLKGLLAEVLSGINGIRGIHCCGNTDWSVLLGIPSLDILSFDAYNHGRSLSLYPLELKRFLDLKGTIAWGIVPNTEEALARQTVASLKDRLEATIAPFTRKGVRFEQLLRQGLLTPSCGLAGISEEASETALELLTKLSEEMRKDYL
ncbi:MAG: methionine synthase [Chloroflexi bacterium]|nr:methionine synthase [Chloroflexota bacterium]